MAEPTLDELAENVNNPKFGDDRLGVLFYLRTVDDPERTLAEGRKCFREREYVKIITPGDRHNIVDRPVQTTGIASTDDRMRFARQYERFRQKQAQPVHDGTPLHLWPGIGSALAEELRYLNVFTVEQLATLADVHVGKIPRGYLLKQRAAEFVAAMTDAAQVNKLQSALAERDARIDSLQQVLDDQARLLAELRGDTTPRIPPVAGKRPRGRPKASKGQADG